jgi:hypothetical protein
MENKEDVLLNESISSKTELAYDVYVYVSPETGAIETIMSFGGFGDAEYDPEGQGWVALSTEDTWRVRDLSNNYIQYKIDWNNEQEFDQDLESITIQKYTEGTLDENYLKQNAIAVGGPLK